jgi:hypothetical protein
MQLISVTICITLQADGSQDQKNEDSKYENWYVLKEWLG